MRRVLLTHDEEHNPSMNLVGIKTIGSEQVVQLEVNSKFICISQPSIDTIKFYSTSDLEQLLDLSRSNSDVGQSMTLRRKIMPNGIEMHRLYFSQRYQTDQGFNSWKISTMEVFLNDQYSYSPSSQPVEVDDAFVFTPKTSDD